MRTLILFGLIFPSLAFAAPFSDVGDYHANVEAITYVKAAGIVEGYADGTFRPDATINRAEFVKILVDAFYPATDCSLEPGQFRDVANGQWFAVHVCVAASNRWVQGYPDGTFAAANTINFVEAAKILSTAFNTLNTFCSGPSPLAGPGGCPTDGHPWYEWYVRSLEARGAIPLSIASFDQQITRGEMAEMIYRLREISDEPTRTYEELASPTRTYSHELFRFSFSEKATIDAGDSARFTSVVVRGDGLNVGITVTFDQPTDLSGAGMFEMDGEIEGTIGGEPAKKFVASRGYCDGPGCSDPYVAYTVFHGGDRYNIVFFGDTHLSADEQIILDSFEFRD